jgi:large subunit ribosomal protein L25
MSELSIEVEKRETVGKNANRRLRNEGLVPAVVYGADRDAVSIQVHRKTLLELMKKAESENPIFLLKLADKERHAMIRDMQVHPITNQLLHVDFLRILMTEKIRVKVPVELVGVAAGVKTDGGVLDFVTREIEVECLPGDIPKKIEFDVTPLHIGQHVEAKDLALPAGVELLDDEDRVIASVSHTHAEQSAAAGDGLIAGGKAEPVVAKKGKEEKTEKGGKDKK